MIMKNISILQKTVLLLILSIGSVCDINAQEVGDFLKEKYGNYNPAYKKVSYDAFLFLPEGYGIEERNDIREKTIVEFYYKEGKIIINSNSDLLSKKVLYVRFYSSINRLYEFRDEKGKEFLVSFDFYNRDDKYLCPNMTVTEIVTKKKRKHYVLSGCTNIVPR